MLGLLDEQMFLVTEKCIRRTRLCILLSKFNASSKPSIGPGLRFLGLKIEERFRCMNAACERYFEETILTIVTWDQKNKDTEEEGGEKRVATYCI